MFYCVITCNTNNQFPKATYLQTGILLPFQKGNNFNGIGITLTEMLKISSIFFHALGEPFSEASRGSSGSKSQIVEQIDIDKKLIFQQMEIPHWPMADRDPQDIFTRSSVWLTPRIYFSGWEYCSTLPGPKNILRLNF